MTSMVAAVAMPSQPAAAQGYDWADGYQSQYIYRDIYRERAPVRRARPSVLPKGADKAEKAAAEGKKPQGPLVIAISIQRQQVKIYDSNGLFAESPISSGMPGHSTPMGVFSIIQKSKYHRSNIYSGAPMPYMQRITWSGVAMHAGVLPGYPASHGCIRMPMSFAMKMWGWTRMGARVVVTPGEVSPADFGHPTLAALVPPAPTAEGPIFANVKTADASNSLAIGGPRVVTDLATGGAKPAEAPADVAMVTSSVAADASSELARMEPAIDDGMPSLPTPAPVDFSDLDAPGGDGLRPGTELAAQAPANASEARSDLPVQAEATVTGVIEQTSPAIAPVATAAPVQAATAKNQDQVQIRPSSPEPAPAANASTIKRNLPVAIFVSRKDGKVYVRQNFKPLFDMPIEIAAGDKALGTHVFTARPANDDSKALTWSVVSLPAVARQASVVADERNGRRRQVRAVEVAQVAPTTPAEALNRLSIPSDLMARIGETLPTGSSLVVSDQGIAQGETGEGTDFIVRLR